MTTITGDAAPSGSETWVAFSSEPTYGTGTFEAPEPTHVTGSHAAFLGVFSTAAKAQEACDDRLSRVRHGAVEQWRTGSVSVGAGVGGHVASYERAVEFDPTGSKTGQWQSVRREWVDLA